LIVLYNQRVTTVRPNLLQRNTYLVSAATCVVFIFIYLALGAALSAAVTAGTAAVFLTAHFALRRGVFATAADALVSVASLAAVFAIARNLGGLESPVMMWLALPPLTAYLRGGRAFGVLVLLGCVITVAATALWPGEQLLSNEALHIVRLISLPAVALVSMLVAVNVERARRESDALAAAANRMKSEFVASVSHEVRTPLHAMLGMTSLLLETKLDERQRELALGAKKAGAALAVLVDDLLDASRIDAGRLVLHPAAADVAEVVRGVHELFAPSVAEKGLAFELSIEPGLPRLVIDAGRVRQVLTNLVDNAVKFTARGKIELRLAWRPRGADVGVTVTVADTGIGIAKEHQEVVFERFRQVDTSLTRRYGGTGLGLAIARDLTTLMGGTLTLASAPGSGTTFTFDVTAQRAPAGEGRSLAGARVLLAEDNLLNQRLAVHLLHSLGCSVDVAQDGAEAVRLVDEHRYDVVLMDCHMPTMDGYRAAAAIRQKIGPELPILALTAADSTDDVSRAREAGMDGFLKKPIDVDGMRASLAGVLHGRASM
jgi:signal transduction histidine kinase/CheY-like chemotaxis protein